MVARSSRDEPDDSHLAAAGIPNVVPCPLCRAPLRRDPLFARPRWFCFAGHGYDNPDVLRAELRAIGWEPE